MKKILDKLRDYISITIIIAIIIIIVSPLFIMVLPINTYTLPAKMALSDCFDVIRGLNNRIIIDSNRKNNMILLDEYLNTNYGIALTKTFTIIDATAYNDSNQVYNIETPFFENGFRVEISNNKHKVIYNSFYSTLSRDPKFQHLYSEWVKKEVGIEDENVEFGFTGNFDKPYIEFDKITSLSKDYSEVFENTHNYKLQYIHIKQYRDLDLEKFVMFVKNFISNYYDEIINTSSVENYSDFSISLFAYNFNFNVPNSLEYDKYFGSKDNINNYTISIVNGKMSNQVYYSYKDESNKTHVEQINISDYLKDQNDLWYYNKQYAQELLHFAGGYPDWTHKYHHAGFDIVANRIIEILEEYMDKNHDMEGEVCYFVTGHSMGGGVANLVAAELLHGESGINNKTDNVYCYTFAAPNTFYITDNVNTRKNYAFPDKTVTETYREPHGIKYRCIFNVVNDDDFVPKLPMEECEWTKYGRVAKKSIEKDVKPILKRFVGPIQNRQYKNYILNGYKSNKFLIDGTIAGFNSIFSNTKNAMRKDTYTFNYLNPTNYVMTNGLYDNIVRIPDNARPYQKTLLNIHHQTPAYFMQCVAAGMHEYNENGGRIEIFGINKNKIDLAATKFGYRYTIPKLTTLITGGTGFIENPHMLESYYALSKEINTTDFR